MRHTHHMLPRTGCKRRTPLHKHHMRHKHRMPLPQQHSGRHIPRRMGYLHRMLNSLRTQSRCRTQSSCHRLSMLHNLLPDPLPAPARLADSPA
jgi:hypothetical protein